MAKKKDRDEGLLSEAGDSEKPGDNAGRASVLSSNFALPLLFGSGRLLPASLMRGTEDPFFDEQHPDELLWCNGPIPAEWSAGVRAGRSCYPIALRLRGSEPRKLIVDGEREVRAILVSDVESLVFASEKERGRFRRQKYEDTDPSYFKLEYVVEPDLFATAEPSPAVEVAESDEVQKKEGESSGDEPPKPDSNEERKARSNDEAGLDGDSAVTQDKEAGTPGDEEPVVAETDKLQASTDSASTDAAENIAVDAAEPLLTEELGSRLRFADSHAGLSSFLLAKMPGRAEWLEAWPRIWESPDASGPFEELAEGLAGPAVVSGAEKGKEELGRLVLRTTLEILTDFPMTGGWPAMDVLGRVADGAAAMDKNHAPEVHKWSKDCRQPLEAEVALRPEQFSDDKNIVLRAVALLLLRDGKLESLIRTPRGRRDGSSVTVGDKVWVLAASLAAFRQGLSALPVEYKVEGERDLSPGWISAAAERGLRYGLSREVAGESLAAKLVYKWSSPLRARWTLSVGGTAMAQVEKEFDLELRSVFARGRELGYELKQEKNVDDRLFWEFQGEGDPQRVMLGIVHLPMYPGPKEGSFVEFVAVAQALVPAKRPNDYSAWASKRLGASRRDDLLRRNGSGSITCRFGISEEHQGVVVRVEQCLENMDGPEFCHHLEHVAHQAADYRKAQGRSEA